MRRLITTDDRQLFVRLHRSGLRCSAIARRTGWCVSSVQKALIKLGERRPAKPGPVPICGAKRDRIIAMHLRDRMNPPDIAPRVGVSHTSIYRLLKIEGVYKPNRSRSRKVVEIREAIAHSEAATGIGIGSADYWRSTACLSDLSARISGLMSRGVAPTTIASVIGVSRQRVEAIAAGKLSLRAPGWARETEPTLEEIRHMAADIRLNRRSA